MNRLSFLRLLLFAASVSAPELPPQPTEPVEGPPDPDPYGLGDLPPDLERLAQAVELKPRTEPVRDPAKYAAAQAKRARKAARGGAS